MGDHVFQLASDDVDVEHVEVLVQLVKIDVFGVVDGDSVTILVDRGVPGEVAA